MPDPGWEHTATLLANLTFAVFAVWAAGIILGRAARRCRSRRAVPVGKPRSHVRTIPAPYDQDRALTPAGRVVVDAAERFLAAHNRRGASGGHSKGGGAA